MVHGLRLANPHDAGRLTRVAVACAIALLVPSWARCGSLTVRDAAGNQWRAVSDPAEGAQGYVLERVEANGQLDPRFGQGGRRPLTLSATDDAPTAIRVDERGRIWASGASVAGGQPQVVILRYLSDGAPDLRWSVQGKAQLVPGGLAIKPNDLLPLADGSLLVAGVAANVDPTRAVVFHLAADGSLDLSFGTRGIWQRTDATQDLAATSLAVDEGGAVAACVVARGDHPAAEIWSIAMPTPKLIEQQVLDPARDVDGTRVAWSGSHWAFGTGSALTQAGQRATLDPAGLAPERAAASQPSDPGQGGFSPFADDRAARSSAASATGDAESLSGAFLTAGGAAMLAVIVAIIVSLRLRRRRT